MHSYPVVPEFFSCALTLLCTVFFFGMQLLCCAIISLFAYPAVRNFFFVRSYPLVPLSSFSLTLLCFNLFRAHLPSCAQIFFVRHYPAVAKFFSCALTLCKIFFGTQLTSPPLTKPPSPLRPLQTASPLRTAPVAFSPDDKQLASASGIRQSGSGMRARERRCTRSRSI